MGWESLCLTIKVNPPLSFPLLSSFPPDGRRSKGQNLSSALTTSTVAMATKRMINFEALGLRFTSYTDFVFHSKQFDDVSLKATHQSLGIGSSSLIPPVIFKSVTTGSGFSKKGPAKVKPFEELDGHQKLVNYFTNRFIRNLVSKKRRRMLVAGYDLDMSYITNYLLAMSFPAEHVQAMYRNPLWQVKTVLDMRHPGCYKVYNLCMEQSYDPSNFHGRVEVYPFDDNHVPPFSLMKLFCESLDSWLSQDPKNIAAIHCMAGKGRTGLMVCVYLVYRGMAPEEALQLYADRRTTDNQGVSIASQRRYVFYWSKILSFPSEPHYGTPEVNLPKPSYREIRRIRLYDMTNINPVFFVVLELQEILGQRYQTPVEIVRGCCRQIRQGRHGSSSPQYYVSFPSANDEKDGQKNSRFVMQMDTEIPILYQKICLDHCFEKPPTVSGDLRVIFYEKMIDGRLFYTCFNTAFIQSSLLQLKLHDLDKVRFKAKSLCGSDFCLELLFGPVHAV